MRRGLTALRLAPLLLCLHAHAATAHLPVRRYTSADGLAQDEIRRMAFDAEGFLWIGTVGGLSRFDGVFFWYLVAGASGNVAGPAGNATARAADPTDESRAAQEPPRRTRQVAVLLPAAFCDDGDVAPGDAP
jgi:ligand-binding sensor domain-containing protein